jgi:membrane-associated phospholipid phosphatase
LVVLHQLDRGRRWAIPRVLTCSLAAGGLADLLKLIVLRTRPSGFNFDGTVWSTFGCWWPALTAGNPGQSFPSAHTATAVGFAVALTWLYPQGRTLFAVLAVLVGCQRIVCGAHYPSDVLIGAAAGWIVGQLFCNVGLLPGWLAQLERRWKPV